jgi:hypothetical protein
MPSVDDGNLELAVLNDDQRLIRRLERWQCANFICKYNNNNTSRRSPISEPYCTACTKHS